MSLRLVDLDPRWVNAERTVFVFRCPHCRAEKREHEMWISCKSVAMAIGEQFELYRAAQLEPNGRAANVVPMRDDCAWKLEGESFENLTVTPSIDASASGHWHGFITNGGIS